MRRTFVSGIVGFLTLTLFLWIFFLWPTLQTLSSLSKQKEVREAELKAKEEYFAKLQELRNRVQEMPQERVAIISESLPDNPSIPSLYDKLQQTAAESGLVLTSLNTFFKEAKEKPPDSISQLRPIDIIMETEGRYEGLKEFVSKAGRLARIVDVKAIEFKSPQKGQIFKFSITLEAYSY